MDYKFLNKVIDQIVNETEVDYDEGRVCTPFSPRSFFLFPLYPLLFLSFFSSPLPLLSFSIHCREVYGLNEDEIEYVWNEYKKIIKDKINNGL
jgi:hypothetical protein